MATTARELRALWWLMRPAMAPWVAAIPVVGFFFAHWDRALRLEHPSRLAWVVAGWLLLHAGTLWLNAALDRDEGEVLFGSRVPVPSLVTPAAYLALGLAAALPFGAGLGPGLCGVGAVLLAVGYSHPAVAWKGHPVGGPVVNALGYGALSPLAGWLVTGWPLTLRGAAVLALVPVMILGFYFAVQAFQAPEDRARGYRTLAAVRGPGAALRVARVLMGAAWGGFFLLALVGWLPEVCLAAAVFAVWIDRTLARWIARGDGGTRAHAQGLFRRMVLACLALLLGVIGQWQLDRASRGPSAGLATRAGWPADRLEVRRRALERQREAESTGPR